MARALTKMCVCFFVFEGQAWDDAGMMDFWHRVGPKRWDDGGMMVRRCPSGSVGFKGAILVLSVCLKHTTTKVALGIWEDIRNHRMTVG